ncbi:ABC transporter permease [Shinella sp. BYT-45]|uniref:ABC transporter permease n=1 Tax=Shinella sp. BYT-45 TaxID=3377377 RepID=UPI00397EF15B
MISGHAAARERAINDLAIRLSLVVVLVLLVALFSILRPEHFPTLRNFAAIITQQGILVLAAIAVTVTLTVNEYDLSVGGVIGIVAVSAAWMFGEGYSAAAVIPFAIGLALLVGALNAVLVVGAGITSFIATLAVSMLLSGFALMLTGGAQLYRGIPVWLNAITGTRLLGVPSLAYILLGVTAAAFYLIEMTPAGRYLRATGSGRAAAELNGLRTRRHVVAAFLAGSLVSGLAGILFVANNGAVAAAAGQNYTLPAYAAAFLGATAIRPVRFNVFGSVVAVLLLSVGTSGLTMIGAPIWVPAVFNACALLFALVFSRWLRSRT